MSDTTTIYNTYRAALRSANNFKYRSQARAGARRQKARQITVDRHNISYQDLKAIIAEHDEKNGITHEKGPDVHRQMRLDAAIAAHQASENPDECPDCGKTYEKGRVWVRFNVKSIKRPGDEPEFVLSCYNCYFADQGKGKVIR